ncbi:MAG: fasciclin domain-containing protein [Gemmatimonadetes bacterium]|nr:fasciclin domain-containing protein [Gemmatimonadota bacterium]
MIRRMVVLAAMVAGASAVPGVLEAQTPEKDIVTVATEAGSFKTLLAAAEAAGLVGTLKGAGPLTVFAPTDEAFAKLPAGTVEALLQDREKLAAILSYHVVPGKVLSADVVKAGRAQPATALGPTLDVRVVDGKVKVDAATVVAADVMASNGVIHVIDTVVLPPAK